MTGFRDRSDAERYRDLVEGVMFSSGLAWWEMDVETGAVAFNERKAEQFGGDPGEFDHYEDFTDRLHPADVDAVFDAMEALLAGDADRYDVEYRAMHPDGTHTWCHDVGGIVERNDGDPSVVAGVVEDVTENKEREAAIRHRNEQLAVLNRIVRHDLKNDLVVITGWLEELEAEVPESSRERVRRLVHVGRRGIELTEAVRDVAAIVEGEGRVEARPVDLRETLETELSRVEAAYLDAVVDHGDLPDVAVSAHPLLSSVFRNLLNNAAQHSDRAHPHISVAVSTDEESATVSVADDGPGIGEDRLAALRGAVDADTSGHGLGLYLVGTLVRAVGGTVTVEPNDPRGTVFRVTLPRADAPR